jgi:hypothetical protein
MKVKALNAKSFFKGLGSGNTKLSVNSLVELNELIGMFPLFYQENDLVWVASEANFYIISVATGAPVYSVYNTGDGSGNNSNAEISIYYGGQDAIALFQQGYSNKNPSTMGYKHGDGIIASATVGAISIFDFYVVEIVEGAAELYDFKGNIMTPGLVGPVGPQGDPGAPGADSTIPGPQGDPMVIDKQGLLSELNSECGDHPAGYAFLATDTGELYFQTSLFGVTPCTWSNPIPFGRGDNGATAYLVFKNSISLPTTPSVGSLNVPAGWTDGPTPLPADSLSKVWMSTTNYAVNVSGAATTTPIWSVPTQVTGDQGLDGLEGKSAGFYVVWSDLLLPTRPISVKPQDFTIDLTADTDWYDDIDANSVPLWMAQISYNPITEAWLEWGYTKMAGEKPSYKLNMFTVSSAETVDPPTTLVAYYQPDGSLTSGSIAAAATAGWTDGPTPPPAGSHIYLTEIVLTASGGEVNNWSTPIQIDGDEGLDGDGGGIWVIWSPNSIDSRPPVPSPVETIINVEGDSLDLDTGNDPDWIDDVDESINENGDFVDVNWMATSYYKPAAGGGFEWTNWRVVRVSGEAGGVGPAGLEARTYLPSTMFTRGDDLAIGNNAVFALYLLQNRNINPPGPYYIDGAGDDDAGEINIHVGGIEYKFTDGIPPITTSFPYNSKKVWMISTVFNSVDNFGSTTEANFGFPIILSDTQEINYSYHGGIGATHTRPPSDPGDGDDNGWYDNPTDDTYWMATKRWAEGVSAQWVWWRIRGEDGQDSTQSVESEQVFNRRTKIYYNNYNVVNQGGFLALMDLPGNSDILDALGNPEVIGDSGSAWTDFKEGPTVVLLDDIVNTPLSSGWMIVHETHPLFSGGPTDQGGWEFPSTINPPTRAPVNWGDLIYGQNRFTAGITANLNKLRKIRFGDLAKVVRADGYEVDPDLIWETGAVVRYKGVQEGPEDADQGWEAV